MKVHTHWPALVPAIRRAGHEPVLVEPLEYDGAAPKTALDDKGQLVIVHPTAPAVVVRADGKVESL